MVCWVTLRIWTTRLGELRRRHRLLLAGARDLLGAGGRAARWSARRRACARACSLVAPVVCFAILRISALPWASDCTAGVCSSVDTLMSRACSLTRATPCATAWLACTCSAVARETSRTERWLPRPLEMMDVSARSASVSQAGALLGDAQPFGRGDHRVARRRLEPAHDLGNLGARRGRRAIGERADLLGDDREPASVLARAGRLDAGVEREEVGAVGDEIDGLDDVADLLGALAHLLHDRGRLGHGLADLGEPGDGLPDRAAAFARDRGHPLADGASPLAQLGDATRAGVELGRRRGASRRGTG